MPLFFAACAASLAAFDAVALATCSSATVALACAAASASSLNRPKFLDWSACAALALCLVFMIGMDWCTPPPKPITASANLASGLNGSYLPVTAVPSTISCLIASVTVPCATLPPTAVPTLVRTLVPNAAGNKAPATLPTMSVPNTCAVFPNDSPESRFLAASLPDMLAKGSKAKGGLATAAPMYGAAPTKTPPNLSFPDCKESSVPTPNSTSSAALFMPLVISNILSLKLSAPNNPANPPTAIGMPLVTARAD